MHKFNILIGILLAFIMNIIFGCHTTINKQSLEPLKKLSKCYILRRLPEASAIHDPLIQDETLKFKTELCLNTHRLAIYISDDIDIKKETLDIILEHVFEGVNMDIKKYNGIRFTSKQSKRLKRYLLEKVFYLEYKIIKPKTTFILPDLPDLRSEKCLLDKIDALPEVYDSDTIFYYIVRAENHIQYVVSRFIN